MVNIKIVLLCMFVAIIGIFSNVVIFLAGFLGLVILLLMPSPSPKLGRSSVDDTEVVVGDGVTDKMVFQAMEDDERLLDEAMRADELLEEMDRATVIGDRAWDAGGNELDAAEAERNEARRMMEYVPIRDPIFGKDGLVDVSPIEPDEPLHKVRKFEVNK